MTIQVVHGWAQMGHMDRGCLKRTTLEFSWYSGHNLIHISSPFSPWFFHLYLWVFFQLCLRLCVVVWLTRLLSSSFPSSYLSVFCSTISSFIASLYCPGEGCPYNLRARMASVRWLLFYFFPPGTVPCILSHCLWGLIVKLDRKAIVTSDDGIYLTMVF